MLRTTLFVAVLMALSVNTPTEVATLDMTEWSVEQGAYKCYMDYRAITDTASPQWQIQQGAYTDSHGLRKVGDRYCIALGSAYGTEIGSRYIVLLDTGVRFKAILADQKADRDTNAEHTADMSGAVVEFVVDTPCLPSVVRRMGDVSYVDGFNGKVKRIYREERK